MKNLLTRSLSFAECVLKEQMSGGTENNANLTNAKFLLPTSNIVERLFLQLGNALTDKRKSINPKHLEAQIFLHASRDFWVRGQVNESVILRS